MVDSWLVDTEEDVVLDVDAGELDDVGALTALLSMYLKSRVSITSIMRINALESRKTCRGVKFWNVLQLAEQLGKGRIKSRIHIHLKTIPSAAILSGIPRTNEITISDGGVK